MEGASMMLIDTNIFIDHLRGHMPATKLLVTAKPTEAFFSAITETELLAGKENNAPEKREGLLNLLHRYQKVLVDNSIAELAGDLTRSRGLSVPDAIIAASTMKTRAILVTKNVIDFRNVPSLQVEEPY